MENEEVLRRDGFSFFKRALVDCEVINRDGVSIMRLLRQRVEKDAMRPTDLVIRLKLSLSVEVQANPQGRLFEFMYF